MMVEWNSHYLTRLKGSIEIKWMHLLNPNRMYWFSTKEEKKIYVEFICVWIHNVRNTHMLRTNWSWNQTIIIQKCTAPIRISVFYDDYLLMMNFDHCIRQPIWMVDDENAQKMSMLIMVNARYAHTSTHSGRWWSESPQMYHWIPNHA